MILSKVLQKQLVILIGLKLSTEALEAVFSTLSFESEGNFPSAKERKYRRLICWIKIIPPISLSRKKNLRDLLKILEVAI